MRPDGGVRAATDIWTATRTSKTDPFGTPQILMPLNSAAGDEPTWISPDGCDLYLQSGRSGNSDLFIAHRLFAIPL